LKKTGKFLGVFEGKTEGAPPIWLMRQAGRYLPEYREVRAKAGSFWAMSGNPELAAEITLQPIRRFDFDAAVIFSDIFVLPVALGIKVAIDEGVGPHMTPMKSASEFVDDERVWRDGVGPTNDAIGIVRAALPAEKAVIGFVGAPWTLATYLANGRGSDDQRAAKLWSYRDPVGFAEFLDRLADAAAKHMVGQVRAGADVVQIFDSWAGGLASEPFREWVIAPTKKVVAKFRAECPRTPVIGFPRATTLDGYVRYATETGVDAVSIDTAAPIAWAVEALGISHVVQGNLDPIALIAGGAALDRAVDEILSATRSCRLIFNLGHGVLPETPLTHVEQLVSRVRGATR
jgi:uroporphyrinogen decarboxylase